MSTDASEGWWFDWTLVAEAHGEAPASQPAHPTAELFVAPAQTPGDPKASPSADLVVDAIKAPALAPPTDTLFTQQWHLTGPWGINVLPAWDAYTGAGIKIAVYDSGIDWTHPDLAGRVNQALSLNTTTGAAGGLPVEGDDNHGTAVAGLIAGSRNGSGVVGVAYDSTLISLHTGFSSALPGDDILAFNHARLHADVMNNSWGYVQTFIDDFSGGFAAHGAALAAAAAQGRGGLGTVIVQAAGNERSVLGDANFHDFSNDRRVITVGASTQDGSIASYSSPGASILVSAPGSGSPGSIVTTDRAGSPGYTSNDFTTTFNGTSAATPQVSGIVALMLEANPALGYRDVQEILAYSARQGSTTAGYEFNGATNWNGGGLHFSEDFGAGLVDARAAVRLAEAWTTQRTAANEQSVTLSASPSLNILDHATATSSINNPTALDIDFIEITVDISHTYRGDLVIRLISPSGVTSMLMDQAAALNASNTWVLDSRDNLRWTFGTTQHWGESGVGNWTLSVSDVETGDTGRLNSWTLRLHGDAPSSNDTYIYTDEFNESFTQDVAHAAQRATLNDNDGGTDTINAAALSGAAIIRLDGAASSIDGRALSITANVIENVFAGDGNDTLAGSTGANSLYGGRGDDTLIADAGNDRLDGGAGLDVVSYIAATGAIEADLSSGVLNGVGAFGSDVLINIEGIGGGSANDTLSGDAGANVLLGGGGNDTLRGRAGDDTYDVDSALDVVLEDVGGGRDLVRSAVDYTLQSTNVEDLALYGPARIGVGSADDNRLFGSALGNELRGQSGHDELYGAAGDDSLFGGGGNDLIDGGDGADLARGDGGNDTYFVDQTTDVVIEAANDGNDTIVSSATFTSVANVELLVLAGNAAISATGTADANTILGNDAVNTLSGLGGDDSLYGGAAADTLLGGDGNDFLYGGAGADRLEGGAGNDLYVIESADLVVESAGGGRDTVIASISLTLPDEVETLVLDGSAAIDGAGNASANTIMGNSAANTLSGGDGNDTLDGGGGADRLFGGGGDDVLLIDGSDVAFEGGAGHDVAVLTDGADMFTQPAGSGIERYELRDGNDVFMPGAPVSWPEAAHPTTLSLGSLNGTTGFRMLGSAGSNLGWSVAGLGDINGDGRDDFAVTAPQEWNNPPGGSDQDGQTYVVFGKAGSWDATLDLTQLNGQSGFRLVDTRYGPLGRFVDTAGDVNGDGIVDLIVGSSAANGAAGAAYVVFGKAGAWSGTVDVAGLNGTNGFMISGASGSALGNSGSTAGDVNGDGFDDLIVGAPNINRAYVVFGHAGTWAPTLAASALDGTNGVVLDGAGGITGDFVSDAGDVNGDGFDDVLVTAPQMGAGIWYLMYGHGGAWSPSVNLDQLNGTTGTRFLPSGAINMGWWSPQVAPAGDVNGDGLDDFLLGAHRDSSSGPSAGAAYVMFGRSSSWGATFDLAGLNGSNGAAIYGQSADGLFGIAVNAAGDVDGDGIADIIVGARDQNAARIIYGHAGAWLDRVVESQIPSAMTTRLTAAPNANATGWSVDGVGDLNGDGAADVIVGANGTSSQAGAAYVVFGWRSTPTTAPEVAFTVDGGAGNDTISGRSLSDQLAGGDGVDLISGADGNDSLYGGAADDTVYGGAGDDTLFADAGDDRLDGGDGVDIVSYAAASGPIVADLATGVVSGAGSFGNDLRISIEGIGGGAANDTISGTAAADVLVGGGGIDTLRGREGDDTYDVDSALDVILEEAGGGRDLVRSAIDYTLISSFVEDLVLYGPDARLGFGNPVNNRLYGSEKDNELWGLSGDDSLFGAAGNDTLSGGADNDLLDGGTDSDTLYGGDGNDSLDGGAGNDRLEGGANNDQLAGGTESDVLDGGLGNDRLDGGAANDTLNGGDGNDSLDGGTENDLLDGGLGDDLLSGGAADDTLYGGDGGDLLDGGAGNDRLEAGAGNDQLSGGSENDVLDGGVGDDRLDGGVANDTLRGGDGGDSLDGGSGNDRLDGGAGNDQLAGGSQDDVLDGGLGDDQLDGGSADDTLYGGDGADQLNGGAGYDLLAGGLGDDRYLVDSPVDVILENAGAGNDTLVSSVSLTLYDQIETLLLDGNEALEGYGNAFANTLVGNIAANRLFGGDGDDRLDGGLGADALYGGGGNDTYVVDDPTDIVNEKPNPRLYVQNNVTGDAAWWESDTSLSVERAMPRPGIGWLWAGRGDFNDDGAADNLFRHVGTGENLVWYLDGNDAQIGAANLSLSPIDTGWGVAGVADFTGDGKADILWRHATTGLTSLWQMNGVIATATTLLPIQVGVEWQIAGVADFTGDGKADILWRNPAGGLTSLWQMNGATPVALSLLSANAPVGWEVGAVGELTGDGKADILWRNLTGGLTSLWQMDGATRVAIVTPPPALLDGNWRTVALQSASGSGRGYDTVESSTSYALADDIESLTLTGAAAINGAGNGIDNLLTGNAAANTLSGAAGHDTLFGGVGGDVLFGGIGNDLLYGGDSVGDVDTLYGDAGDDVAYGGLGRDILYGGDGNDILDGGGGVDTFFGGRGNDIFRVDDAGDVVEGATPAITTLFGQNRVTGDAASWDVTSGLGAQTAETRPGIGWLWAGRGDFNNDGAADSLFRHVVTGENRVWYLDASGAKTGEANLSISPVDTGWSIAGVGDFTGDGKADILWRHQAAGLTSLWRMDGVNASATTLLPIQVGSDWQIAGAADFTGDGKMDILWRHATAGLTSLWQMDGTNPVAFGLLAATAPVGWDVGAVGDFTGDGKADIAWRTGGGGSQLWEMNGATRVAVTSLATSLPGSGWAIIATASGDGYDRVESAFSRTLETGVEELTLTGAAAINGTGNSLDNVLTGNAATNTLIGAAGHDSLFGGDGADVLFGGANSDLLYGGDLGDTLFGDTGDDVVYGGLGADLAYGGDGRDTLDGGGGIDALFGGASGDVYRVDDANDVVVEGATPPPITTLFAQNRVTGDVASWDVTSGLGVQTATSRPGSGWLWAGRGDFNDDGVSDNLFRHVGTGENRVWYLDGGGAKIGEANLSISPVDTGWSIAGVGDFTGDNKADILWRHQDAGLTSLWRMDGVSATATTLLPIQVGSDWHIAGAADFTGDGKMDILWRHATAGLTSLWQMDGASPAAFGLLAATAPVGWEVGAVGDFTGDGKADIAWRTGGGGSQLWEMNGATRVAVTTPASLPDSDWMTIGLERTTITDRDRVESSVSYTLGGGVEDLTLVGGAAINGTGNAGVNTMIGNAGANTLTGGLGNDALSGGGGNDIFAYAAGDGDDAITDFGAGDKVDLSGVAFANAGASANIAVLSDGHTLTAQAGYVWIASDFI